MSRAPNDPASGQPGTGEPAEPVRYPANAIVAILDKPEQAERAVAALTSHGFLASEIGVSHGPDEAARVAATTGRTGLAGLAMSIADWFGAENDEMRLKSRYEDALRDGGFVVRVVAPTDARRERATQILGEHGAHTVAFHGRYTIEGLIPPSDR